MKQKTLNIRNNLKRVPTKKELNYAIEIFSDVLSQLNKMKKWGFVKSNSHQDTRKTT